MMWPAERALPQRGFTLLEVMIVLAILGFVVALAAPFLGRRSSGAQLLAATRELRAAISSARTAAIAAGQPIVFRGDRNGGYWLDDQHYQLVSSGSDSSVRIAVAGGTRIALFPSGGSSGGRVIVRA